jgi:hypothetical protein
MTTGMPAPRMTAKRFAWLKLLEIVSAIRSRSRVGYDCMQLGWTEWNYVNTECEAMTGPEAKERYGEQWWNRVQIKGERLTDAGREALKNVSA